MADSVIWVVTLNRYFPPDEEYYIRRRAMEDLAGITDLTRDEEPDHE